jgi:hypothetical protein
MWAALHDLATWLLVLKYMGLCLAAGSSIWGTVNELTEKAPDGRRRLTRAGLIAISFTVLGLIISLVSEDLQRKQGDASHSAQIAAEAKRTNEIIISGQQLTSLKIHWQFASKNTRLEQVMADGAKAVKENSENEQGGVPEVPFDVEDYRMLLLPLISFVASPSEAFKKDGQPESDNNTMEAQSKPSTNKESKKEGSTVVLMALDASANAILSFGMLGKDAEWTSEAEGENKTPASAGFVEAQHRRPGNSTPRVTIGPAAPAPGDGSTYEIDWDLDPGTLAGVIDRRNPTIAPTAKFPKVFRIAILHDGLLLPFEKNNFGVPAEELWKNDFRRTKIDFKPEDVSDMKLSMTVNGFDDMRSDYALKRVHDVDLNTDDYDVDTKCTILEFEAS